MDEKVPIKIRVTGFGVIEDGIIQFSTKKDFKNKRKL
jgi:hypothetical protein